MAPYRALKIGASIVSAARGDLEASNRETVDAWEFGAAHHLGWNFATSIQRGHFALWAGDLAEAEHWYSDELTSTGKSYCPQVVGTLLFAAYAETGDPREPRRGKAVVEAARSRRTELSGCLDGVFERSVIGLARLGWPRKRRPCARSLRNCSSPARGPTRCSLRFRRLPGSPAPCAHDWEPAEGHHLAAIRQTDIAPYRLLPTAFASGSPRCFSDAGHSGDFAKAESLIGEAVSMYEALGLPCRARLAHTPLALVTHSRAGEMTHVAKSEMTSTGYL